MMKIIGLDVLHNEIKNGFEFVEYASTKGSTYKRLRLRVKNGVGEVVYLENGLRPKMDDFEISTFSSGGDAALISRVLMAMAKIHLKVDDGYNDYSDIDVEFIMRGFSIFKSDDGNPVWRKVADDGTTIQVEKEILQGLPGHLSTSVRAYFSRARGNTTSVCIPSAEVFLMMMDEDVFPQLLRDVGTKSKGITLYSDAITRH